MEVPQYLPLCMFSFPVLWAVKETHLCLFLIIAFSSISNSIHKNPFVFFKVIKVM